MAVAKVGQGLSYRMVALELLCSVSTVADSVRRSKQTGRHGLLDRRAGNDRCKVGEPYEAQLKQVLEGTPQDMGWLRTTESRLVVWWKRRESKPPRGACGKSASIWLHAAAQGPHGAGQGPCEFQTLVSD
ncbi:hypothetical protein [Melittangium boletus]|uniref:hypothetical protein n=1 Tax=Melittangium boletus TaxID=83453 RepID=UPI003DA63C8E